MTLETITVSNLIYAIYLLGALFSTFALLFTIYYREYVVQKLFIKSKELEKEYELFSKR